MTRTLAWALLVVSRFEGRSSPRNSWRIAAQAADGSGPDAEPKPIEIDLARMAMPVIAPWRSLPALLDADLPVSWENRGDRHDRLNLSPSLLHVCSGDGRGIGLGDPLPGQAAHVLEAGGCQLQSSMSLNRIRATSSSTSSGCGILRHRTGRHPGQTDVAVGRGEP